MVGPPARTAGPDDRQQLAPAAGVPLGEGGGFTFFAAPGTWTVRVLAPGGVSVDRPVSAGYGRVAKVDIEI